MNAKRKVLVLRLSSLGDIIHASSVFSPLRAAGAEIFFVVKPAFADLIKTTAPDVRVYIYDSKANGPGRKF
jgi:ADP-heptose:LPS heptosyltransferase